MSLNNREIAALVWLSVAAVGVLCIRSVRPSLLALLTGLLKPVFLIPLLAMTAWISLELNIASRLGLWGWHLLPDTAVWAAGTAVVLFFRMNEAKGPAFFGGILKGLIAVGVFTEFFINLFVLSLFWELVLQPAITLILLLAAVSALKPEHLQVKKVLDGIVALIGFAFLAYVLRQTLLHWRDLSGHELLQRFLLPIWLTVGLFPFLYLLHLYIAYDSALRAVNWATSDRRVRWKARYSIVRHFHIRSFELRRFAPIWIRRMTSAPDPAGVRHVVAEFRAERKAVIEAKEQAAAREKHYAGSDAVDADGRRLDRREFDATMSALRTVAACQSNWHRTHNRRYRPDVLAALGNDFTSDKLPLEHGITLHVDRAAKAWYAWRRTVTGWCFGIGAVRGSAPWLYDGPTPPAGFPAIGSEWQPSDNPRPSSNWSS